MKKTYVVKKIKRNGLIAAEREFLMCKDAVDFALNESFEHLFCVFDVYMRTEQGDVFLQQF